jgi:hypothetical protein
MSSFLIFESEVSRINRQCEVGAGSDAVGVVHRLVGALVDVVA